jgi:hypothetical protein
MGRPLRVELADGYYHGLSRGSERRAVFLDDADRERFVALLGLVAERFELEPWAYVLMPNHYHLVLHTWRPHLSCGPQWLGTAYTNWLGCSAVSMACRRAERQLRREPALQRKLRKERIIDI